MGPSSGTKSSSCCQMSRLVAKLLPSLPTVSGDRGSHILLRLPHFGSRSTRRLMASGTCPRIKALPGRPRYTFTLSAIFQATSEPSSSRIVSEAAPAFGGVWTIGCSSSGAHGLVCRVGRELQCLSPTLRVRPRRTQHLGQFRCPSHTCR